MAADVWMPHFGLKLHEWRTEGIIGGDLDVDTVCAALIRRVGWPWKITTEMRDIFMITNRLNFYLRTLVVNDVGQFFGHTAHAITSHLDVGYDLKRTDNYEAGVRNGEKCVEVKTVTGLVEAR